MGDITLTAFGGILPRTSDRLLPDNAAQVAVNCRLSSGELVPFNAGAKRYSSAKTWPLLTIERILDAGAEAWLAWPIDVDVVKAPLYGTGRWCFTGDGEPRITTRADAVSGAGNDYPHTAYTLGTPKPVTAPTVTPSGGVGSTVDRYYGYSFYEIWGDLELEGALSPISGLSSGKVDGTWAITAMDATPPNSGTVVGVYASSETEFTDTVPHWLRVGEQVVIAGATLTVTAVTNTLKFKVAGDYSAATAWARKAAFPGTIKKRLYRTTGTTGQWQLVAEGITGTTYSDTLTDAQIPGDELISATWEMPPVGLQGLFWLPSGALGGFIGNKACFSEPNQPHAFPPEYEIVCDYDIVAAECFGSGVVLATEAAPFVIQGVTPGQMSGESFKKALPCLSKRSIVSIGDMVLYASAVGFVSVSAAGVAIWSRDYFTDQEFADYAPATMVGAVGKDRVFFRYTKNDIVRVLVFNLETPELIEAHIDAADIHCDKTTDTLYYSNGSDIYEFAPATGYAMTQDWQSKEFVLSAPKNLGAAKVTFDQAIDPVQSAAIAAEITAIQAANAALLTAGKINGAWATFGYAKQGWNGSDLEAPPAQPPANQVTFHLYADGDLKLARTVSNSKPFKLPSGYKASRVSVRVMSQCRVRRIELGDTMKSLGNTG